MVSRYEIGEAVDFKVRQGLTKIVGMSYWFVKAIVGRAWLGESAIFCYLQAFFPFMIRLTTWLVALFFITSTTFGQMEELLVYKRLYRSADSLNRSGQVFSLSSAAAQRVVSLDAEHPAKYFETIGELMKSSQFNDAAFLFYLARLRYRYYNAVNAAYEDSGDGAMLGSFEYVFGETLNLYLKTNIRNFVSVVKASGDYFAQHDYAFYPKAKGPAKYDTLATAYAGLIKDLETNKAKYRKAWDEERVQLMKGIDEQIDEYNKLSPEEKKRLGGDLDSLN
jgi:hypothetical protein